MESLLTIDQVAERLGVTPQSIRAWIRRGRIGVIRLGPRSTRISLEELQRFLDEASTEGNVQ